MQKLVGRKMFGWSQNFAVLFIIIYFSLFFLRLEVRGAFWTKNLICTAKEDGWR